MEIRVSKTFVRTGAVSAALAASIFLAGCQKTPNHEWRGEVVEPPSEAPEIVGVNWTGDDFRLSEREGKVSVVFFGYTFCPDICPFALAKMKQIHTKLGDRAEDFSVVFVSVDPHRDSVEKLAGYVPNFHDDFFGVHLDFDQLDQVKETFDITVQYGQPKEGPGTDSFYYVDHTGTFYVIDREGQIRVEFPPNATAEEMLPDIEYLIEAQA